MIRTEIKGPFAGSLVFGIAVLVRSEENPLSLQSEKWNIQIMDAPFFIYISSSLIPLKIGG